MELADIKGKEIITSDDERMGKIADLYVDDDSGQPKWGLVRSGFLGTRQSFFPLEGIETEGDTVRVPYTKTQILDAPGVDPDGYLSEDEEQKLYSHYSMSEQYAAAGQNEHGTVGHDTSGPTTDDAMTRSEEQLRINKTQQETSRARLRKYVVTENVNMTVPVQKEVARLEREPITEANMPKTMDGPAMSEADHEVVLSEERIDIDKEVVPKERVRLTKDVFTAQQPVFGEVQKEVIETEGTDEAMDDDKDGTRR